jgi:hypothetical protein
VKYQEAAYFVSDNTMWVGLYIPSTANWKAKGVTVKQECLWPAEKSTIKIAIRNLELAGGKQEQTAPTTPPFADDNDDDLPDFLRG